MNTQTEQPAMPGIVYKPTELTIETREGFFIWQGRDRSEDKHRIIGFKEFFKMARYVWTCARRQDPYAYLKLVQLDAKIDAVHEQLLQRSNEYSALLQRLAPGYLDSLAIPNPVTVEALLNTPYAHQAIRLFSLYESVHKMLLIADDAALIESSKYRKDNKAISRAIKSLVYALLSFRHTGLVFEDCGGSSPRLNEARRRHGPLPRAILSGQTRPRHVPRMTWFGLDTTFLKQHHKQHHDAETDAAV